MINEKRLENMERDLDRLKRRNRWLLGAILLVVGGLIVSGVFETTAVRARAQAEGTAKEIRSSAFLLEDEKGILRASLKVDKDGSSLVLADESGKFRARLGVSEDGPSLRLYDQNEKDRAGLIVYKGSTTSLALWDETGAWDGKPRVIMGVPKEGPGLSLRDEKGKLIWSAIK